MYCKIFKYWGFHRMYESNVIRLLRRNKNMLWPDLVLQRCIDIFKQCSDQRMVLSGIIKITLQKMERDEEFGAFAEKLGRLIERKFKVLLLPPKVTKDWIMNAQEHSSWAIINYLPQKYLVKSTIIFCKIPSDCWISMISRTCLSCSKQVILIWLGINEF